MPEPYQPEKIYWWRLLLAPFWICWVWRPWSLILWMSLSLLLLPWPITASLATLSTLAISAALTLAITTLAFFIGLGLVCK